MRVTNRMMAENAIQNLADNMEKVNNLQNKLALNKNFLVASDDPTRASASMSLRSNLKALNAYSEAASLTQNWMTATDSAFDRMEQLAVRANDLILQGLNDTLVGDDRAETLGVEMQSILNEAVEIGNTSVNGQYIFSGYQINQKAFALSDSPTTLPDYQGNPFTPKVIAYLGDQGSMQRSIGPDQSVPLNVRGDQAVLGFLQNLILATNALTQNNIRDTGNPLTDPLTLESVNTSMKASLDTLDLYRTSNGAHMRQVDSASNFLESIKIETQSLLSANEDINIAEGISLLSNQQTTYNAVLEVSQRAMSALSLFDYLR